MTQFHLKLDKKINLGCRQTLSIPAFLSNTLNETNQYEVEINIIG